MTSAIVTATAGLLLPTHVAAGLAAEDSSADSGSADEVPTLRGSGTIEWAGEFVGLNLTPPLGEVDAPSALCGSMYRCADYDLAIDGPIEDGTRLRVALTNWEGAPTFDALELAVVTPDGEECRAPALTVATHGTAIGMQAPYSREAVVAKGGEGHCNESPRAGQYVIRVIATTVAEDGGEPKDGGYIEDQEPRVGYRVRAALERPTSVPGGGRLLPDLTPPTPPWGFHFGCKEGLDSPPQETTPAEHAGQERVCLRYSFSFGNVGRGLLDLRFDPADLRFDPADTRTTVPLTQRIYHPDATPGRYEPEQAYDLESVGTAHLHTSHSHWHVTDYYSADLLRVEADGTLSSVRPGMKQGLCSSPWYIVDFARIRQDDPDVPSTGCDLSQSNTPSLEPVRVALPANWGDFYAGDNAPDNFVDITGEIAVDGEHEYVLRYVLNPYAVWPDGRPAIIESDVTNNTAYAHIRITREDGAFSVCTLGRGFGDDPWATNAVPLVTDSVLGRCPTS